MDVRSVYLKGHMNKTYFINLKTTLKYMAVKHRKLEKN